MYKSSLQLISYTEQPRVEALLQPEEMYNICNVDPNEDDHGPSLEIEYLHTRLVQQAAVNAVDYCIE
jgi:hypothetical protein